MVSSSLISTIIIGGLVVVAVLKRCEWFKICGNPVDYIEEAKQEAIQLAKDAGLDPNKTQAILNSGSPETTNKTSRTPLSQDKSVIDLINNGVKPGLGSFDEVAVAIAHANAQPDPGSIAKDPKTGKAKQCLLPGVGFHFDGGKFVDSCGNPASSSAKFAPIYSRFTRLSI